MERFSPRQAKISPELACDRKLSRFLFPGIGTNNNSPMDTANFPAHFYAKGKRYRADKWPRSGSLITGMPN